MRTPFIELSIVVLFALLAGCGKDPAISPPINNVKAIAIARNAVAEDISWVDRAEFAAFPDGNGWMVFAWCEPIDPEGFWRIEIDENGKVQRKRRSGQSQRQAANLYEDLPAWLKLIFWGGMALIGYWIIRKIVCFANRGGDPRHGRHPTDAP